MSQKRNNDVGQFGELPFIRNDNFIWVGDISNESLIDFYREFSDKEADDTTKVIPIIISSYGGEIASLMAMRDLIKSSPKPVATIALGKAMSSGACLLAAGTKGFRFASQDTLLMFHEVSGGAMGKTSDVVESAQVMEELNKKLLNNLAEDCGLTFEEIEHQFKTKKNADWTMTAQTAKKWGFIDHIAIPRHITHMPEKELAKAFSHEQMKEIERQKEALMREVTKRVRKAVPRRK